MTTGFPSDLKGARVAVVGLGKSGVAAARFLAGCGADVVATDDQPAERLSASMELLANLPIQLELGGVREATLRSASLIVLSPGVPPTLPPLYAARRAGVPITGELELASRFIQAPIVGITGTNGKSTVTSLCGAIAEATGRPTFTGGNLGTPLLDAVDTPAAGPAGIVVCEMSSYQLETADSLRCAAAAVLNLTPDHLDRYGTMTAYGDAKSRIAGNLHSLDPLVLSADDPEVRSLIERNHGIRPVYFFSTRSAPLPRQMFMERLMSLGGTVEGDDLVLRGAQGLRALVKDTPGQEEERYPISELQLVGRHNLANVLSAYLLMRASGLATYKQVRRAGAAFRALSHRMQLLTEVNGVRYYDDSKGTNVDAVVAGIDGFPRPFVLIAGGRDKGGSYALLRQVLAAPTAQVRGVVLIGEAAPLIEQALLGVAPLFRAATLEEAVQRAHAQCHAGDAVILSPACSSFDMFRDYVHRAEVFRHAVHHLTGAKPMQDLAK